MQTGDLKALHMGMLVSTKGVAPGGVRFFTLVTWGFTGLALAISTSLAACLRRLSSSHASSASSATPASAPMMIPAIAPPEMPLLPPPLGALAGLSARVPVVVTLLKVVAPGALKRQVLQATVELSTAATVDVILEPESANSAEP